MSCQIRFQILDDTFQGMPSLEARKVAFYSIGGSVVLAVISAVATIFLAIRDLFTGCTKEISCQYGLLATAGFILAVPLSIFTMIIPEVGLQISKPYSTFLFGIYEKLNGRDFNLFLNQWQQALI